MELPTTAPSYLAALLAANPELAEINAQAMSGSSKPMPPAIVANKGRFLIKKDGVETPITFPDNDANRAAGIVGMPVPQLQAVILKGKPGKEKAWYVTKYQPGEETTSPDCYSEDGVKPAADSRLKQCDNCASCPQNVFGSGTKQDGSPSDGKACADRKVVAIFAAGSVYRFAVPPASLSGKRASGAGKAWDPYCADLSQKGLPLPAVITTISFEQGEKDYQLNFNFGGMLAEKQLAAIIPMLQAPEVAEIINPRNAPAALPAPTQDTKVIEGGTVTNIDTAREAKEKADAEVAEKKTAADKKKAAAEAKKAADDAKKAGAAAGAGLDLGLGEELSAAQTPNDPPAGTNPASEPSDDELLDSLGL